MRYFLILFLFCGLSSHVWACDGNGARVTLIRLQVLMNEDFSHKKVGDVLYSHRATLADLTHNSDELSCSDDAGVLNVEGNLVGREAGKRVYQTATPGIGIRILYQNRQPAVGNTLKVLPFTAISMLRKKSPLRPEDIVLKIELIKTGPVASAPIFQFHQAALLRFVEKGLTTIVNLQIQGALPETVCNFNSPQTIIHLPTQSAATITARKPALHYPLPVKIICNGEPNFMTITLSGDAYNSSQGILKIENTEGSARGVGLQFWYRSLPLRTGKPLRISSPGRLTTNNQLTLPFFVSYVRTNSDIIPGKISVGAVLHIEYL